jgi:hypothetical protein
MPWWAVFWIIFLAVYAVVTTWNDRYEKRHGLVTWMAVVNAGLAILFLMVWAYPLRTLAVFPTLPTLASLSAIITLWHGSSGYRQIKSKNPQDYLPLEHQTLVQINALSIPFEIVLFGLPIALALLSL